MGNRNHQKAESPGRRGWNHLLWFHNRGIPAPAKTVGTLAHAASDIFPRKGAKAAEAMGRKGVCVCVSDFQREEWWCRICRDNGDGYP